MSLATIALLGLATAVLIAALAATYWSLTYPGQPSAGTTAADDSRAPHVLVRNEQSSRKKYVPRHPANTAVTPPPPASHAASVALPATAGSVAPAENSVMPSAGKAAGASGGQWAINLESFSSADEARAYAARLARQHLDSDIMAVEIKGKRWYRVRMPGFASRAAAEQRMHALEQQLKLHSAWLSKSAR